MFLSPPVKLLSHPALSMSASVFCFVQDFGDGNDCFSFCLFVICSFSVLYLFVVCFIYNFGVGASVSWWQWSFFCLSESTFHLFIHSSVFWMLFCGASVSRWQWLFFFILSVSSPLLFITASRFCFVDQV